MALGSRRLSFDLVSPICEDLALHRLAAQLAALSESTSGRIACAQLTPIALTRSRCHPGARQLLERRRQTHHDTTKGGLSVLERHLSDVVYRVMIADIEARDIASRQAHQAVA